MTVEQLFWLLKDHPLKTPITVVVQEQLENGCWQNQYKLPLDHLFRGDNELLFVGRVYHPRAAVVKSLGVEVGT